MDRARILIEQPIEIESTRRRSPGGIVDLIAYNALNARGRLLRRPVAARRAGNLQTERRLVQRRQLVPIRLHPKGTLADGGSRARVSVEHCEEIGAKAGTTNKQEVRLAPGIDLAERAVVEQLETGDHCDALRVEAQQKDVPTHFDHIH